MSPSATHPGAGARPGAFARAIGPMAAVVTGLAAGAMLAEAFVLVPWWRAERPEAFLAWYASNASRLFDFFAPLEIGSALLAIGAAAVARRRGVGFAPFLAAALLTVAVLVPFPLYFDRANASFADGSVGVEHLAAELARWAAWHEARTAIGVAAFAAAVLGVGASRRG